MTRIGLERNGRPSFECVRRGHQQIPRSEAMKRYYFDMRDGDSFAADEEGLGLPDIEAAQEEAALSLADMARDAVRIPRRNAHFMQIEVRDDSGPVLQAKFVFSIDRKKQQRS